VKISVTVRYHNILRRYAGVTQEEIDLVAGSSVRDVLSSVADLRGSAFRKLLFTAERELVSHVVIFRNRKLVTHDQLDTQLADQDALELFPAVSGG